jgi:hypothetical protein
VKLRLMLSVWKFNFSKIYYDSEVTYLEKIYYGKGLQYFFFVLKFIGVNNNNNNIPSVTNPLRIEAK